MAFLAVCRRVLWRYARRMAFFLAVGLIALVFVLMRPHIMNAASEGNNPPSNITCQGWEANSVIVSWQDNDTDEASYRVERQIDGGGFSEIATVAANSTSYKDTGIDTNKVYQYRVRAAHADSSFTGYSAVCSNRHIFLTSTQDNHGYRIFYGLRGTADLCPQVDTNDVCLGSTAPLDIQKTALEGSAAAFARVGFTRDAASPPSGLDKVPVNVVWCDGGGCAGGGGLGLSPFLLEKPFNLSTRVGDPAPYMVAEHENFHFEQFKYGNLNDPAGAWVIEGQARSTQDKICLGADRDAARAAGLCFDDVTGGYAGYIPQINAYLGNPNRPINQTAYDAALFWTYLTEKFGTQPVDNTEGGMNLLVKFWEASANTPNRDGIANLNDALAALGTTARFRDIWKDFAVAGYAKDLTGQPSKYKYADIAQPGGGAAYNPPAFTVDANLALNTPLIRTGQTVRQWGANYYRFKPAANVPFLDIKFTQDTNVPVYYTVIGVKGKDYSFEYNTEGRNLNKSFVNNGYSEVVVIVAGLESLANYRIAVNGTQPSLQILTPTTFNFARVGSSGAPEKFRVAVQLLAADATPISGVDLNLFNFRIAGADVPADHVLTQAQIADQEWFILRATTQTVDGFYDFSVNYNHIATLDVTQTTAIDYVPRTSADNMLVIDRSGSMGESGGAKLNTAKDAAKLYVDSWRNGDKIGVITFANNPTTTMTLQDWSNSGANTRQTAINAIQGMVAAGGTNIGDSLTSAFSQLQSGGNNTHDWAIILLSDGKEEASSPAVNFPTAVSNIANATGKHTAIHAIAIGPDADGPTMQNAATATGGTYQFVSAPVAVSAAGVEATHGIATTTGFNTPNSPTFISDPHLDLDARYRYIAADEVGHQQFYSTTGAATLADDNPQNIKIPVEGSVAELSLSLSFHNSGFNNCGDCNIELTDPNNVNYAAAEVGNGLDNVFRTEVWRIPTPKQGIWNLHIEYFTPLPRAASVHSPADTVPFLVQADIKSDVILDVDFPVAPKDRVSGVPMPIVATLTDTGPVLNATVFADIVGPDGTPYSLVLFDDGNHGDGAAGDGVYANTFYNTLVSGSTSGGGSYNVTVTAFGNSIGAGGPFTRQKILGFFIYGSGDDDHDGLPNEWEQTHGGGGNSTGTGGSSTVVDPNGDPDHDGVPTGTEAQNGTDPNNPDTDGGGEPDGSETSRGSNPLNPGDDQKVSHTTIAAYPGVSKVYVRYAPQPDYNLTQLFRSDTLTGTYTLATDGEDHFNSGIFTDTSVTNDQLYCYYVVGITITGYQSGPSNVACTTPKADPGAPDGGFLINGGAQTTSSHNVKLTIFASDQVSPETLGINKWDDLIQPPSDSHTAVTKMAISNDAQMRGASFVPYATSAKWTLAQTGGLAMVYMQFEDAAGNLSAIVPNGITLVSGGSGNSKQTLALPFVSNR